MDVTVPPAINQSSGVSGNPQQQKIMSFPLREEAHGLRPRNP